MESSRPSTPPSKRSAPRLLSNPSFGGGGGDPHPSRDQTPPPPPPSINNSPTSPSPLHLSIHHRSLTPLRDLLLLSPPSSRKSRPRSLAIGDSPDHTATAADVTPRKKTRGPNLPTMGCGSPKCKRRARRRLEKEIDRDSTGLFEEDVAKPRKRRQSTRPRVSRKQKKMSPVSSAPSLPKIDVEDCSDRSVDGVWEMISELVMWKNVAKSTLWFGIGSMFFFSSCFSRGLSFSIISCVSHLGIVVLAFAFFFNSFTQRQEMKRKNDFKLTEDDVLRASRLILPIVNAALVKAQRMFSGEPLMTLKMVPVLLFGAQYGHLITPWRLFATGFFLSFAIPKLLSCYTQQIQRGVGNAKRYFLDAWNSCRHKKIAAGSAAILLWNLLSVKTRIFAAFVSMVLLRYRHQLLAAEENAEKESKEGELEQAIILAE